MRTSNWAEKIPDYPDPESCPICRMGISPIHTQCGHVEDLRLQVVYRCPRSRCASLFIARYKVNWETGCQLQESVPLQPIQPKQKAIIREISPSFEKIYGRAVVAETTKLDEIAGVGFRRSLEFLIKDYLLATMADPPVHDQIKKQALANCINNYVKNDNIKEISKRAVWLGNDETHYVRKWEDKDITDLKNLIAMTVSWIELEQLTLKIKEDMKEPRI